MRTHATLIRATLLTTITSLALPALGVPRGAPQGCISVLDARQKSVGNFLALQDDRTAQVLINLDGRVLGLTVGTSGVLGGFPPQSFPAVFYESPDCTGQTYVLEQSEPLTALLPRTAVAGAALSLYATTIGSQPQSRILQSARIPSDDYCIPAAGDFGSSVPAEFVRTLRQDFEPPFRLNIGSCSGGGPRGMILEQ